MTLQARRQEFLLENFDLFMERLCYTYPFDIKMLRRYRDVIRWDVLSFNENMVWTEELVLEFRDYLDFGAGDLESETKWINLNRAIPWSCELLEELQDKVQWRELSANTNVRNNEAIRYQFYHRLEPFMMDQEEQSDQSSIDEIEWILNYIEGLGQYKELCFHTEEEIQAHDEIDWKRLSQNIYLPWSQRLLEKYEDKWDWEALSVNESLPWSMGLIRRFRDKWTWGGLDEPNPHGDRMIHWGLTSNEAIYWDRHMMEAFKDEHDWFHLSSMIHVDWCVEVLSDFEDYLDYDQVLFNDAFWKAICGEDMDPEFIEHIYCIHKLEKCLCPN